MRAPTVTQLDFTEETGAQPGRVCPLHYHYGPAALSGPADFEADTLYVAGGLYGNAYALEGLLGAVHAEAVRPALVFNGDFHWFDATPCDFAAVDRFVMDHTALRGNVETEIAGDDDTAGCGCAYPAEVGDAEVARSNRIIERLRNVARAAPRSRARLAALPMHLVAEVGGIRVGIVHGDADSLAGWSYSTQSLAQRLLHGPSHELTAAARNGIVIDSGAPSSRTGWRMH